MAHLLWPAVGGLWQLFVGRRRPPEAARRIALVSLALTATATIAHVAILAELPAGRRALLEPLVSGARIGQFDGSLALWFDPLAAAAAVLACVVALAAALLVPQAVARPWGWRAWAWIELTLGASLVAFLADGFVTTAIGWSLASLSVAWLAGWTDVRAARAAATRGAVAVAALLVGALLLFHGMGGSWDGDEFVPDVQPQFVAVRVGDDLAPRPAPPRTSGTDEAAEPRQGGTVTLTGAPGASVFVDDARKESLRAPFVAVPVRAGIHGFRIHRGAATEDAVVPRVAFEGGDEIALEPLGPTLAFRTVADQLLLRDRRGDGTMKRALQSRRAPGGLPLVGAALLAWLVAAAAMGAAPTARNAPAVLVAVACGGAPALLGPYLLARVFGLAPLVPYGATAVAWLGAAVLLGGALRARRARGMAPRFLAFVSTTPAGVPCLALGMGGSGPFLEAMMASGFAAAVLHLVASRKPDWLDEGASSGAEEPAGALMYVTLPERLGEWFASMERWVVDAVAGALAGCVRAGAWMVATADAQVVSTPVDVAATRLTRLVRRVDPLVGGSVLRVVWVLLGGAGAAALLHALWPAG